MAVQRPKKPSKLLSPALPLPTMLQGSHAFTSKLSPMRSLFSKAKSGIVGSLLTTNLNLPSYSAWTRAKDSSFNAT